MSNTSAEVSRGTKFYIAKVHLNNLIFLLDSYAKGYVTSISTTEAVNQIYQMTYVRIEHLTKAKLEKPVENLFSNPLEDFGIDWEYGTRFRMSQQIGELDKFGSGPLTPSFSFTSADNRLANLCIKIKDEIDLINIQQQQGTSKIFTKLTPSEEPKRQTLWIENNNFNIKLLNGSIKAVSFNSRPESTYFLILEILFEHWKIHGEEPISQSTIINKLYKKIKENISSEILKSHLSNLKKRFEKHDLKGIFLPHFDRRASGYVISFNPPTK